MRKKLSVRSIETIPVPTTGRVDYWDEVLTGFGIRVSPTGRKSWFLMGRVDGKQRRHTIGTYPKIGLADAREEARKVLGQMELGTYQPVPPTPEKVRTFGNTVPEFIDLYAKQKNRRWQNSQGSLRLFAELNDIVLQDVLRRDVVRVLDQIMARGTPYAANRALAAVKKMFSWALDRGMIEKNPVAGLKAPAKEQARDRILTEYEVASFWQATEQLDPVFVPYYRLLLLTGQRRSEVATMRWSEIDFARRVWTISADTAKNGRVHEVPLSDLALSILTRIPRFLNSDLVFTTTGRTPVSGFSKSLDQLQAAMGGISDWRIHDLRRTCASGMARMGVAPHIIEKVLNHISGQISGVAAVYNRHGYDAEKRDALERWSGHVRNLVNSATTGAEQGRQRVHQTV